MARRAHWGVLYCPEHDGWRGGWYLTPWYPTKHGYTAQWSSAVGPFATKREAIADKRENRRPIPERRETER